MSHSPEKLLEKVATGELSVAEALGSLRQGFTDNLGHTRIDLDRESRVGMPEVIFGAGKTAEQIQEIAERMVEHGSGVLITRLDISTQTSLQSALPGFEHLPEAGIMFHTMSTPAAPSKPIAVVSAGTSDRRVALEAGATAAFYGNEVEYFNDCGVAGLHRLLEVVPEIHKAGVVIAVAGMEAALASVLAGQVSAPVIAVPTSVGYGASFGGVAALLSMLNSCASGVTVVNIDNGFGAGYAASQINRLTVPSA